MADNFDGPSDRVSDGAGDLHRVRQRVDALLELHRYDEARTAIAQGLAQDPNDFDLWWSQARVLSATGEDRAAVDAIERTLSLAPEHAGVQTDRGRLLARVGRHKESIEAFEAALSLAPGDATVLLMYTEQLVQHQTTRASGDRLARANELLPKLLSAAPSTSSTHTVAAKVYLAAGDPQTALRHADLAVQLDPNATVAHQVRGLALEKAGDTDAAGAAYVTAGKLDPRSSSRRLLQDLGKGSPFQLGLGALVVYQVATRVWRATGRDSGLGTSTIIVAVGIAAAYLVAFWLLRKRTQRKAIESLSPEVRAAWEASRSPRGLRRWRR